MNFSVEISLRKIKKYEPFRSMHFLQITTQLPQKALTTIAGASSAALSPVAASKTVFSPDRSGVSDSVSQRDRL
jgi:hypothetical protein